MAILCRRMKAPCTALSGIHHETLPSYEEQQPFGAHESYNENDSKSLSLTYQQLQEGQYCCDIIPSEPAIWVSKSTGLRLSTLALSVIGDSGSLPPDDLEAYVRLPLPIHLFHLTDPYSSCASCLILNRFDFNKHIKGSSYRDPISGLISTVYGTVVEVLGAATSIPSTACVTRIIRAGLMAPHDYTMALTEGFHNVPKLYGDDTVRDASEVVGFQSGMAAAGKVRF